MNFAASCSIAFSYSSVRVRCGTVAASLKRALDGSDVAALALASSEPPRPCAFSTAARPACSACGDRNPPNGLPHQLIAMPQCAIAQAGSFATIDEKVSIAATMTPVAPRSACLRGAGLSGEAVERSGHDRRRRRPARWRELGHWSDAVAGDFLRRLVGAGHGVDLGEALAHRPGEQGREGRPRAVRSEGAFSAAMSPSRSATSARLTFAMASSWRGFQCRRGAAPPPRSCAQPPLAGRGSCRR